MQPLDKDDLLILQLLQCDARLNNKEIADKVGKSVTRIYERRKRLEELGYIKQYVAILDKEKVGKPLTAYTHVQLKEHAAQIMKKFESEVIKFPEVMECCLLLSLVLFRWMYVGKMCTKLSGKQQN